MQGLSTRTFSQLWTEHAAIAELVKSREKPCRPDTWRTFQREIAARIIGSPFALKTHPALCSDLSPLTLDHHLKLRKTLNYACMSHQLVVLFACSLTVIHFVAPISFASCSPSCSYPSTSSGCAHCGCTRVRWQRSACTCPSTRPCSAPVTTWVIDADGCHSGLGGSRFNHRSRTLQYVVRRFIKPACRSTRCSSSPRAANISVSGH